jgi:lipopolysaccharide transport system permease protein
LSHSSESLVNNANLITKVYFPRAIVPLASILTAVVDAAVAFCLLIGLLLVFHVPVHLSMLLCPAIAAVGGLCAAGAGLWLSALNLQFRDVRYALPFFIQMLVYVTPVFYPTSLVPDRYRFLLVLNPMAAVVDNFRQALFGQDLDLGRLGLALAISILLLVTGFIRFRQLERNFADRI